MTTIQEHPVHGPYADMNAALVDAQPLYECVRVNRELMSLEQLLGAELLAALRECHVALGEYDLHEVAWLADWEAERVVTVRGWIERAYAAGQDHVLGLTQTMLDDPSAAQRDVALVRCCVTGCVNTELLPVGSGVICPDHGGEHHELRHDHGHDTDLEGVAL